MKNKYWQLIAVMAILTLGIAGISGCGDDDDDDDAVGDDDNAIDDDNAVDDDDDDAVDDDDDDVVGDDDQVTDDDSGDDDVVDDDDDDDTTDPFFDDFESYTADALPPTPPWYVTTSGDGEVLVRNLVKSSMSGAKALQLDSPNDVDTVDVRYQHDEELQGFVGFDASVWLSSGDLFGLISYDFQDPDWRDQAYAIFYDGGLFALEGEQLVDCGEALSYLQWYKFTILVDTANMNYDVFLDDLPTGCTDVEIMYPTSFTGIQGIGAYVNGAFSGTGFIDNVRLYTVALQ